MPEANDSNAIHRESIEWCDIWVTGGTGTELPRVLLIGDSITRGYYPVVAKALRGDFAPARLASSKCVGDPIFFKELDLVLAEYAFDIIHFNNGMHGWDYSEAEYAAGLEAVLDVLGKHVEPERLIWAHTTPVRSGDGFLELDEARSARVQERNRIATALAEARGMPINDLYSAVIDHPEAHCDTVHFNDAGQTILGERVVMAVQAVPRRT